MTRSWRQRCLDNPNMMFNQAYRRARDRAKNKGLSFNITEDYITNLFEEQGGKCYYSDIKLNIVKKDEKRMHDPLKMTLDCVSPEMGYTKGNVVWCAYCVNSMKQKMSFNEIVNICKAILVKAEITKG